MPGHLLDVTMFWGPHGGGVQRYLRTKRRWVARRTTWCHSILVPGPDTGEVYGLPRHLFHDTIDRWAEGRGVLVKAIEDVALGTASVYRQLEVPLPEKLPFARERALSI